MSQASTELASTGTDTPRDGPVPRFNTYLAVEMLVASFLGILLLGRPSFWLDEAFSIKFTSGSWSELFDLIADREAMSGLYYVTLKTWSLFAGTSELAARLPSVVFYVIAVWALVLLARLLFSDRIALIAGLLLTVNPFLLVFAREARAYAMVTAFITVATLLFVRLMLFNQVDLWLLGGYTTVGILSVYAHAWSIFVLAGSDVGFLV